MSNNHNNNTSSGIGLSSVLTIVFVVLKLVGVIDWSWWWVFSPTLINVGLAIIVISIYAIYIAHDAKKDSIDLKWRRNDKWKF